MRRDSNPVRAAVPVATFDLGGATVALYATGTVHIREKSTGRGRVVSRDGRCACKFYGGPADCWHSRAAAFVRTLPAQPHRAEHR